MRLTFTSLVITACSFTNPSFSSENEESTGCGNPFNPSLSNTSGATPQFSAAQTVRDEQYQTHANSFTAIEEIPEDSIDRVTTAYRRLEVLERDLINFIKAIESDLVLQDAQKLLSEADITIFKAFVEKCRTLLNEVVAAKLIKQQHIDASAY